MSESDLILPISRIPSVDEFLGVLNIRPAGFAAQLFTAIYEDFFSSSKDLRAEYMYYYSVEYPTFEIYLELAHEIYLDPTEIEKTYVLKINSPGGVLDEAYEDNVRDTVIDCIRTLEVSYEG